MGMGVPKLSDSVKQNNPSESYAVWKSKWPNYRYVPHNDVSVNDGPNIRQWSRNVIMKGKRYNRPGVALRVPGGLGFQIFMTFGT
jgi:hypothetical protein